MSEEQEFITANRAIELLPDGDTIHTFRSSHMVLLGADWARGDIVKVLSSAGPDEIQIGGPQCRAMGHGIVLQHNGAPLFIEHRKEELP